MQEGRIIKALSGFYYVQSGNDVYACKGRGVFRKKKINPLVGDFVVFDKTNHKEGYITEIKPRENELVRPPIANVNQAVVIASAKLPDFSPLLLDRFLVLNESKGIKPVIFITKMDLPTMEERKEIEAFKQDYEQIGYPVELIVSDEGSDIMHVEHYLEDKVTVIMGQSGVGKSSVINALNPLLLIETDEISVRLGRGKHTTRYVELVKVANGLVADTPGFSSIDVDRMETEELASCFPEMKAEQENCRFRGCLHHKEPNCAVKKAVDIGDITTYRYENYIRFLEEIQMRKPRY